MTVNVPIGSPDVSAGAMRIPDACDYSGLSRTTIYTLEREGRLRLVRVGRRVLVPRRELERVLAEGARD